MPFPFIDPMGGELITTNGVRFITQESSTSEYVQRRIREITERKYLFESIALDLYLFLRSALNGESIVQIRINREYPGLQLTVHLSGSKEIVGRMRHKSGVVMVGFTLDGENKTTFLLKNIHTFPKTSRKGGLAKEVVEAIGNFVRIHPKLDRYVAFHVQDKAVGFWEKCGFQRNGAILTNDFEYPFWKEE